MMEFREKLKQILKQRGISLSRFSEDTGIDRVSFFYKRAEARKPHVYMAIAYYLGMTLEELLEGTEMEDEA